MASARRLPGIGIDSDLQTHVVDLPGRPGNTVGELVEVRHYPVGNRISPRLHRPAVVDFASTFALVGVRRQQ